MDDELRAISTQFLGRDEIVATEPLGSGHIHETYRVDSRRGGEGCRTVLQRINTRVFADPHALCQNLDRITRHLRAKLAAAESSDLERRCLTPLRTCQGALLARDERGAHWRAFVYVDRARTADRIEGPAQARGAAWAFARFAADLVDLPGPPLVPTIPDFHGISNRIRNLDAAVAADAHGRAASVRREIESSVRSWEWVQAQLAAAGASELPARVMHNDCKLNNLLLDEMTGEGICVIDLDTTMEATILADFGQLVRTGASRAAEDETRLDSIRFEDPLFDAIAAGYLAAFREHLTAIERGALAIAGPTVTLQNAVRFLADHLAGDVYFRIHRAGHNLDRARAQLRLFESMRAHFDGMRRSIDENWIRTTP